VDILDGRKGGSMESWMAIWMDIMNILQSAKEIWRCNVTTYEIFLRAGKLWPGILILTKSEQTHSRPNKYARNYNYQCSVLTVVNCDEDLTLVLNLITN
jgi:hypothetical protein